MTPKSKEIFKIPLQIKYLNWASPINNFKFRQLRRESTQTNSRKMIEVLVNDRLGKKIRVKCLEEDTVGDFKKVLALQLGVPPTKIVLQKGGSVLKDHIMLEDYEIHDNTNLELYYL